MLLDSFLLMHEGYLLLLQQQLVHHAFMEHLLNDRHCIWSQHTDGEPI
jgi:hypothetical protein